jgi:magnesium transporter
VIIRDLALGDVVAGDAVRAMRKELIIGTINGFALGLAIGLIGFGWKGSLLLGLVAGTAMLVNQILGACSGVAIPFALRACKIDPALASSILVTTLTDMLGFFVFLGLAKIVLSTFGI